MMKFHGVMFAAVAAAFALAATAQTGQNARSSGPAGRGAPRETSSSLSNSANRALAGTRNRNGATANPMGSAQ